MSDTLDELREHGREVIAKVRLRQQHDVAVKRPADTRTDAEIKAAYDAAMREKRTQGSSAPQKPGRDGQDGSSG